MSCPCCGKEAIICKISYDIYPLIPPKKIPFPINLFKKPTPTNGIKKEFFACEECLESENNVDKSGIPYEGIIITKLKEQNPDMIICHVKRVPEKEILVEKIEIPKLVVKNTGSNSSIKSDDLSK